MEVVVVEKFSTFHLKSDKLAVDLLELTLVVVELSLLKNSEVESPEELED